MTLLERYTSNTPSLFSKIGATNFFTDKYASGFTKFIVKSQYTGEKSRFGINSPIVKYKQ